jgi:TonB family protein
MPPRMAPRLAIPLLAAFLATQTISGQKTKPQPDKDGVYAVWNGVKAASLIFAAPVVLPAGSTSIKHICALLVVVSANGTLKKIAAANKTAGELDYAAINALEHSRFEPGNLDGSPVATQFMIWFPFLGDGHPVVPIENLVAFGTAHPKVLLPPLPTSTPEAEFSEEARRAHYNGTSVFHAVIDENGLPRAIGLISPAGKGLDQKALEAVHKYKFKPATLYGLPVPFLMTIEVHFRLQP